MENFDKDLFRFFLSEEVPHAAKGLFALLWRLAGSAPGVIRLSLRELANHMTAEAGDEISVDKVRSRLVALEKGVTPPLVERHGERITIYHPAPEKRIPAPKATPLFDEVEKYEREKASENASGFRGENHREIHATETPSYIFARVGAPAQARFPSNKTEQNKISENVMFKKEDAKEAAPDAGTVRQVIDFSRPDVSAIRQRVAWIFRESIEENKPIRPALLDRITAGIVLGLPRFTFADCESIAKEATTARDDFRNQYVRGGREWIWQTVNLRFADHWINAGGRWPTVERGIEPKPIPPVRQKTEPAELEPTTDELIAQSRGEQIPESENLEQTARRLKVSVGEALLIRSAYFKLKKKKRVFL